MELPVGSLALSVQQENLWFGDNSWHRF